MTDDEADLEVGWDSLTDSIIRGRATEAQCLRFIARQNEFMLDELRSLGHELSDILKELRSLSHDFCWIVRRP